MLKIVFLLLQLQLQLTFVHLKPNSIEDFLVINRTTTPITILSMNTIPNAKNSTTQTTKASFKDKTTVESTINNNNYLSYKNLRKNIKNHQTGIIIIGTFFGVFFVLVILFFVLLKFKPYIRALF
jgi:hypothetical protein